MIVYDLLCSRQHRFEGWFASADDYSSQRERSLVRCPLCDDAVVDRRPSANMRFSRETPAAPPPASEGPAQAVSGDVNMLALLRRMVAATEDVGALFSEEARKIHYDESPKRSIRGQATPEEAEALRDEGIEFMPLPDVLTRKLN